MDAKPLVPDRDCKATEVVETKREVNARPYPKGMGVFLGGDGKSDDNRKSWHVFNRK
jgi:hypothetical protein